MRVSSPVLSDTLPRSDTPGIHSWGASRHSPSPDWRAAPRLQPLMPVKWLGWGPSNPPDVQGIMRGVWKRVKLCCPSLQPLQARGLTAPLLISCSPRVCLESGDGPEGLSPFGGSLFSATLIVWHLCRSRFSHSLGRVREKMETSP